MKVALYGNICNNFYTLAKSLRNHGIADAHLYLYDKTDIQNRPESDDPEIKNNYPDWIHMSSRWDVFAFLKKFDRGFIRELSQYDVVFLSDMGVVLAPYLRTKTIFFVTGGDLTRIPFSSRYMQEAGGFKLWCIKQYVSFMQRNGIRRCDMIITQPFYPFTSALKRIKVDQSKVSDSYYPFLIDTNSICYNSNARNEIVEINRKKLHPFSFVIFHPSRLFIEKKKDYEEMGVWKGNDNLLKGFALFLKKYKITNACIAMPEREHSPDIEVAKKIIGDLDIEENIVWLTPPNREGFPRNELINYYSLSNLVADEFGTGWFGAIVIEGMSCNKPTFCYVDEGVMKKLYPWHTVISVKEPSDIAKEIARFYFDDKLAAEHGERSRKWVEQFHSIDEGSQIYIENLKRDLGDVFQTNK
jgi:glycosyltransferase involved in cell wall biosynthesis